MTAHILSFTVYTLAMIGVIFIGFFVAQKSLSISRFSNRKNQTLSIESSLSLEPRKNLYIVKAGEERILISTDSERSNFLTKLNNAESIAEQVYQEQSSENDLAKNIINFNQGQENGVMRKLLSRLNSNQSILRGN